MDAELKSLRETLRTAEAACCLANNLAEKAHTFGTATERATANRNLRAARAASLAYAAHRETVRTA